MQKLATSVARGLERSGQIISGAAAIVVLIGLSSVAAYIVLIKALGLGTAIAIFLDATLRSGAAGAGSDAPAGECSWRAPRWLQADLPHD